MLFLFEWLWIILLAIFLAYEVFGPIFTGKPLFPHFRKSVWTELRLKRAQARLDEARAAKQAAELEAEAKQIEDEVKKLNTK